MATGEPQVRKGGNAPQRKEPYVAPTATIKTDTERKRNIDAGLSKAQLTSLAKEEERIHKIPVGQEEAVVIDEKGNVNPLGSPTITTGTRRSGKRVTTYAEIDITKVPENTVLIHNHPKFKGDTDSIATRIGYPFTPADIQIAINTNVKEIRAIAKGYTYSLKRPAGGWPSGMAKELQKEISRRFNDIGLHANSMEIKYGVDSKYWKTTEERANLVSRNSALKAVAQKYGVIYARKKHNYS